MGRKMLDYFNMYDVSESGCWLFQGRLNKKGYGEAAYGELAHRYFYKQLVGPIPEGLQIDHLCMVTRCVNPAHMEPVTVQENLRRKYAVMVPKSHCRHGHEFAVVGYYTYADGSRECITCRKVNKRRFRVSRGAK